VVVGTAEINAKGAYRLFVHDHGSLSLLRFPERGYGYATGLNNKGVLIGASWTAEGDCLCGFSYADGQWTALRSPVAGQRAEPRAINDSGLVVGWADFEVGRHARRKAVAWRGGTPEVLLDLGGRVSEAHGMNRLGDIVGGSHVRGLDTHHAYLIHDGQAIDLDGDAGSNSDAYAINDAGQVVGYRSTNDRSGAFLVHEGQMLWLEDLLAAGTPEGIQIVAANSINQQGQIVGQAFLPGKSGWHAILLTPMAR
jgi:probable HAF family extracellular repeat protein